MKKQRANPVKIDAENPEWDEAAFTKARPASEMLPQIFGAESAKALLKPRGRPKSPETRTSISLRLPPETLARWKATGPGWQTRMADTLTKAV